MNTGEIKFFNATKGYGFIKDDQTGKEIFLHITGLIDQPINQGDKVSYDIQDGRKGVNAVNVKKIWHTLSRKNVPPHNCAGTFFILIFVLTLFCFFIG